MDQRPHRRSMGSDTDARRCRCRFLVESRLIAISQRGIHRMRVFASSAFRSTAPSVAQEAACRRIDAQRDAIEIRDGCAIADCSNPISNRCSASRGHSISSTCSVVSLIVPVTLTTEPSAQSRHWHGHAQRARPGWDERCETPGRWDDHCGPRCPILRHEFDVVVMNHGNEHSRLGSTPGSRPKMRQTPPTRSARMP